MVPGTRVVRKGFMEVKDETKESDGGGLEPRRQGE